MKRVFLVSLLLTLVSCGSITKKGATEEAMEEIPKVASFDLDCPKEKLNIEILDYFKNGYGVEVWPKAAGVSGCGKKGRYVKTTSGWILNTNLNK